MTVAANEIKADLAVLQSFPRQLRATGHDDAVQQLLLDVVVDALGHPRALVALPAPDGRTITGWLGRQRDQAGPLPAHVASLPVNVSGGLAAATVMDGTARVVDSDEAVADPWLRAAFGRGALLLPLPVAPRQGGLLVVGLQGPLSESRRATLETLALLAAAALESVSGRLRRARESAVQAERARIALDLHDSVSQSLFGIRFTLEGARRMLPEDAATVRNELSRAVEAAEGARQAIRRAIHDLWPATLTAAQFEEDLRLFVTDVLRAGDLALEFDVRGEFDRLSPLARRGLYRVCQEALTNVVHHAAATEARLCVDIDGERARLVVRDDGQGFEPALLLARPAGDNEEGGTGFGLAGMQQRTEGLGGRFELYSRPGAGTSVVADIPVRPEADEHD